MVGLVKLVGMVILAWGVIFLMKPDQIKKTLRFWIEENHLYLGALLNILIGIIFLITAPRCDITWIVVIFGILSLVKGLLLFILGRPKIVSLLEELIKKPAKTLRGLAMLSCILGIILIWAA